MKTIKTFKRYELKFIVAGQQFDILKDHLARHMIPDAYCLKQGSYMIYNLYLDNENDDVIRHSLEKPYYKEKLRLRSYKMPIAADDRVFLEIKKKINGIVAKRRAAMTYYEAEVFINDGIKPRADNYLDKQVIEEISDFLNRYDARPKVFISYERVAYFDENDHDFRISFDKNILTRRNQVNFTDGDFGSELMDADRYVMEIKIKGQIPLWLCRLLSEMKIYKTSFSKYGTEYRQYAKYKTSTSGCWKHIQIKNGQSCNFPKILLPVYEIGVRK